MRLLSFAIDGTTSYGAAVDGGVIDLGERARKNYPTVVELIQHEGRGWADEIVRRTKPDYGFEDLVFKLPVPAPQKIWCIGVNYSDRNEEYADKTPPPVYPSLFSRAPTSLVGHEQPVERPRVSEQLDYEGEIVLVVGKEGRHIPKERAFEHLFGLTLCNEGTVRDWLRHGKFNVTQGKNFDRSGSIGPWIVTADELNPRRVLEITTRVNGEVRQRDTTERLIFSFDYLIAYLSTFATLKPGDLIATGTPTGAGARFNPPRWLKPGDTVEVEVPGIGKLINPVVDEAAYAG